MTATGSGAPGSAIADTADRRLGMQQTLRHDLLVYHLTPIVRIARADLPYITRVDAACGNAHSPQNERGFHLAAP